MDAMHQVLKSVYCYEDFRPGQDKLISHILAGRDVLGIMPTGAGKSLCYQVPALLFPGLTIVVSPLISLMEDQVRALKARGVRAETISSAMTGYEKAALLSEIRRQYGRDKHAGNAYNPLSGNAYTPLSDNAHNLPPSIVPRHPSGNSQNRFAENAHRPRSGNAQSSSKDTRCRLLYVSPERLLTEEFKAFARSVPVSFLCVDEAHCVSQWGRDFRPAYRKIADFINSLPTRPCVAAFTATATPEVRSDIIDTLGLDNPLCLSTGFDRKNLYYEVRRPKDKWKDLLTLLKKHRGECGILYCLTRRTVDSLHARLVRSGIQAAKYHGGMTLSERAQNQEDWLCDRARLIVATNAFGMGIDKPDVRFVIHYNMPADMENYYQEAGRAGRDGLPSDCILLYADRDITICRFFISKAGFIPDDKRTITFLSARDRATLRGIERERLRSMQVYAGSRSCLRKVMLEYFGEHAPTFCGRCSYCLGRDAFAPPKSALVPGRIDEDLLRELRALRKELADRNGLLPYKICSDTAICDMALLRPTSYPALLLVRDMTLIGAVRFGRYFIRDTRTWVATH